MPDARDAIGGLNVVQMLVCLLALGGAPAVERAVATVDLPTLVATASARSPQISSARLKGQGDTLLRHFEQPSAWPELRAGFKAWPIPQDVEGARYRAYVQLRFPLLLMSYATFNKLIYSASEREGAAATLLARQLMMRNLVIAYAVAHAAQESRVVYAETRAMQERQLEILKARLREGASTQVEVAQADEALAATVAAADEAERSSDEGRERIAALTGVDVSNAYLQPLPEGLAARDGLDAETRARAQRAEVKLRQEMAARFRAQAKVAWRGALGLDIGVGYAHGTTGTLDELSGLSTFIEAYGPLDAPWRAAREHRQNLTYAQSFDDESRMWAEQVAAEAHDAFTRWQHYRGQARAIEARVQMYKAIWEQLKARAQLVPKDGQVATAAQINAAESAMRQAQGQLMEARAQEELWYATLLAAEATDVSLPGGHRAELTGALASTGRMAPAPSVSTPSRAIWLWRTPELLASDPDAAFLSAFLRRKSIDAVYLSWPRGLADDARLPRFVHALAEAHVRVEALMGEASWYQPHERSTLLDRIDDIARYNQRHPGATVAGVHLDIEPQQLAENKGDNNRRFLPELVAAVGEARATAERARLDFSADIARKLLKASAPEAAALVAACPHLTLMLYELPHASEDGRVEATVAAARTALAWGAEVTVGIRALDYGPRTLEVARKVDAQLQGTRGYRGWAIHDYATMKAFE